MGGGGNFTMSKSPYDMPKSGGLRNFCGKCAEAPMAKVRVWIAVLMGLGFSASVATSAQNLYHPRFATWHKPCGEYKGPSAH